MNTDIVESTHLFSVPWNSGRLIGQKPPFGHHEVSAIRIRLQIAGKYRDMELFKLAIGSKLRGCDLVSLRVSDVTPADHVLPRTSIVQRKTGLPVRFELTDHTRLPVETWIAIATLRSGQILYPCCLSASPHLSTRQYARIVKEWAALIRLDPEAYGTHSLRRTKATLIYGRTKNLRAMQLLLGH